MVRGTVGAHVASLQAFIQELLFLQQGVEPLVKYSRIKH